MQLCEMILNKGNTVVELKVEKNEVKVIEIKRRLAKANESKYPKGYAE